ncbi:WD repeat-containing protein [Entamoeba marina]
MSQNSQNNPLSKSTESSVESVDGFINDDNSLSDAENNNPLQIPFTNNISFPSHKRAVTSIAIENGGSRFFTGGYDSYIHLYDFGGMDSTFQSFRTIEPTEGSAIHSIQFAPSGDLVLVSTAHLQIKLFDRNGYLKSGTKKGDMYIVDLKKTFGHVGVVTDAHFHPIIKDEFLSSSVDGTLRLWDVNMMEKTQKNVVKLYSLKREEVNCCSYNRTGDLIAGGITNRVVIHDKRTAMMKPICNIKTQDNVIHNTISWLENDQQLVIRDDQQLRLFDTRMERDLCVNNVTCPTIYSKAIISPDNRFICCCSTDSILFYNSTTFQLATNIPFENGTSICWNDKINQIFVGDNDGNVHIYFDEELSQKGCLMVKDKIHKEKDNIYEHQEKGKEKNTELNRLNYKPVLTPQEEEQMLGHLQHLQDFNMENPRDALLKYASENQTLFKKENNLQEIIHDEDDDEYKVKRKK